MKSTKDIYLAAAWMALGAKYERVDKTDPRHQVFYFSSENKLVFPKNQYDSEIRVSGVDLDDVEKNWANGTLSGNLYEFSRALQRMKSIIHSS